MRHGEDKVGWVCANCHPEAERVAEAQYLAAIMQAVQATVQAGDGGTGGTGGTRTGSDAPDVVLYMASDRIESRVEMQKMIADMESRMLMLAKARKGMTLP